MVQATEKQLRSTSALRAGKRQEAPLSAACEASAPRAQLWAGTSCRALETGIDVSNMADHQRLEGWARQETGLASANSWQGGDSKWVPCPGMAQGFCQLHIGDAAPDVNRKLPVRAGTAARSSVS
jgi:hypothetical protein